MYMAKIVVQIPLVVWRDGRPRFSPGPAVRKLGFKGEDLRHGKDGPWFDLNETIAWAAEREKAITAAREASGPRKRKAIVAGAGNHVTVSHLFAEWFAQPRMNGKEQVEGKKRRRPLSENSVAYYANGRDRIEKFDDGRIWLAPAAAISSKILDGVLDRIEVHHGLATARCVRATLSALYGWARGKHGIVVNPVAGTERLPELEARVRYGSIAEMQHFVRAADVLGRPEIGDSQVLGLWSGQRQNDRLAMTDGQMTSDGMLFRQSKKRGQPLLIPASPELATRLAAARERRRDWRVNYPHVILDERTQRPFETSWYRQTYARVRAFAVTGEGIHEVTGEKVTIEPMPSLADFHDQDLRDTAVTWLALAGNDKIRIASITGHSLKTVDDILKHYLGMHPELARSAIASMVSWYEKENSK